MNRSIAHRLTNGKKEELEYPLLSLPYPLDVEIAKKNLLSVKAVLDKSAIPFWLLFGTCLGAVRDGSIIPHDKDVDLGLYKEIANREVFYEALMTLQDLGFEIIRTTLNDDVISIMRDKVYIDFYSMTKVSYNSTWTWGPYIEDNYFSRLGNITFLGTTFRIPSPIFEYIEARYGKNWRTPIERQKAVVRKL